MRLINTPMASLALAITFGASVHAQAADTVTFAGWGGALQDAERTAYLKPAEKHWASPSRKTTWTAWRRCAPR